MFDRAGAAIELIEQFEREAVNLVHSVNQGRGTKTATQKHVKTGIQLFEHITLRKPTLEERERITKALEG